jgi:hypothetical protein
MDTVRVANSAGLVASVAVNTTVSLAPPADFCNKEQFVIDTGGSGPPGSGGESLLQVTAIGIVGKGV